MRPRRAVRVAAIQAGLVLGAVLLLEALCRTGIVGRITMVAPSLMVIAAVRAMADPALRGALLITASELLSATALSVVLGAAVGVGLFLLPPLRRIADPVLGAWYAVPLFVFYPVMIVLFGVGQAPIVAIAFVFSVGAMVTSTLSALDRIPRALFRVARIHQLGLARRIAFVLLPAALPHLVVGLRLVVAYSLIAAVAGEFILSSVGIGHEIAFAYDNFETAKMYGLIVLVILLATILNGLLSAGTRRLDRAQVAARG